MQSTVHKKAIEGYSRNAVETEVDYASPYRIIQMLMDGALTRIATAKGCISRNDISEKSRQITWCMNIINGLRSSLDAEQGGEIALNLDALYDYMSRKLLHANVNNDIEALDEVSMLLSEIKNGWDNIPAEFH